VNIPRGTVKKSVNAVVFADDSTLVAMYLGKSFATGRDFGRDQELHVRLNFRGDTVPSVPSGKSFRCLGVQFNCRLNGIEGKSWSYKKRGH
jgi:hypothetical protein